MQERDTGYRQGSRSQRRQEEERDGESRGDVGISRGAKTLVGSEAYSDVGLGERWEAMNRGMLRNINILVQRKINDMLGEH